MRGQEGPSAERTGGGGLGESGGSTSSNRLPSAARSAPRRLDQHFLRSARLAAELVRDAGLTRDDLVVEIGAGSGRLTIELARVAGRVIALELDPALAAGLRRRLSGFESVTVAEGDGLRLPLPRQPFRTVANLPFGQTTGILRRLLDDPHLPLERADLIVEWGAGLKRAVVWPGTFLGVAWGAWWTFRIDRRLPAACFEPAPSVDAALLVVARRDPPLVPVEHWQDYRGFVARGFRRGVRSVATARELRRVARAASARDLDAHQWAALFRAVRRNG